VLVEARPNDSAATLTSRKRPLYRQMLRLAGAQAALRIQMRPQLWHLAQAQVSAQAQARVQVQAQP
jgi:hypothetical protein